MAFLNRLVGIGAGLAITGAAINATLYNGESHFKLSSAVAARKQVPLLTFI